jgi:hypothetical protein
MIIQFKKSKQVLVFGGSCFSLLFCFLFFVFCFLFFVFCFFCFLRHFCILPVCLGAPTLFIKFHLCGQHMYFFFLFSININSFKTKT